MAVALAALAYLLAQLYGQVTGNHKLTEKIQQNIPTTKNIQDISRTINGIQRKVAELPTSLPTPVNRTTVVKGAPGEPGKPGQVVTAPPRVVVITTPAPAAPPVKPCRNALLGTCLAP